MEKQTSPTHSLLTLKGQGAETEFLTNKPVWHVLGAGSIGCLWAASLCKKGHQVRLILREPRYQQIRAQCTPSSLPPSIKIKLSTKSGQEQYRIDIGSSSSPGTEAISRLIVATKAQDALAAVTSIKKHLSKHCRILLLQNGMGSQQSIASALPEHSVWAGSSTDGAYLKAPFDVVHAGRGTTFIGPLESPSEHTAPGEHHGFEDLLHAFHLKVQVTTPIEQKLWEKLVVNSCINGLTALFNCKNGELLDQGQKQGWLDQLIEETSQVLEICQPSLDQNPEKLAERVYHVCRMTAANISSTCQDVRQGRKTELGFINRFLINQAEQVHLKVPGHHQLMEALAGTGKI